MKTKSFRGILADGGQDKIYLSGDEPGDGYRIKKFQIMSGTPGAATAEHVVKIFKIEQTNVPTAANSASIDFSDNILLAAGIVGNSTNISQSYASGAIAFDNEIFNQDIYITHTDNAGSEPCNYYIELEQVKLTNGEQAITNFVAALNHGE